MPQDLPALAAIVGAAPDGVAFTLLTRRIRSPGGRDEPEQVRVRDVQVPERVVQLAVGDAPIVGGERGVPFVAIDHGGRHDLYDVDHARCGPDGGLAVLFQPVDEAAHAQGHVRQHLVAGRAPGEAAGPVEHPGAIATVVVPGLQPDTDPAPSIAAL